MNIFYKNILFLVFVLALVFTSCSKDVKMRTAVVTVVDDSQHLISGAKITVYVNSDYANTYVDPVDPDNMIREVEQYTNSEGYAKFEFERDCVFEAKIEKNYVDSIKTGSATLVFKEESEFTKTVVIK